MGNGLSVVLGVGGLIFLQLTLFKVNAVSGPLINRFKWFSLKIRFPWDIRERSDSAQANTAQSQKNKFSNIKNWPTHCGVRLCSVTAACTESNNFFAFEHLDLQRTLPASLAPLWDLYFFWGEKTTAFLPPMPRTFHYNISTGLNLIDWFWSSADLILCREMDILYQCRPFS